MMEILLENADEYLAEKEAEREQAIKEAEDHAKKVESGEIIEDSSSDDNLEDTEIVCRTEGDEDDPIYQILEDTKLEQSAEPEKDIGVTRPFSLQEVVRTLPELSVLYNKIEPNLLKLTEIIQKYNLSYVPDQEFGEYGNPHELLDETQELGTDFKNLNPLLKSTLKEMPELLGSEKPVTFLVVPQNDKELRASGGLLTAYGTMTINEGDIEGEIDTYDMWILENYTLITLGVTPPYRNEYGQLDLMLNGCGAYHLRAQDSGIYPDNYVSMDMFKDYYDIGHKYKPEEYPPYDHVVTFNTHFIADLIKAVEPLELSDGEIMCANNAAKTIFSHTSVHFDDYKTRKSYIGEVGDALQDKLFDLSAKDFLKVAQVGIKSIEAKHISFYSEDKEMQEYFDEIGLSARTIHDFDGDYFHFNEAQNCGLKANFYIYNNVDMNINIADNGRISKDIKVKWTNEKVYDHDERHILTDRLNWRYRAWLRFYGPQGTTYTNAEKRGMVSVIGKYYQSYRYYDDEVMKKQVYDDVMWFDHRRSTKNDPIKTASVQLRMTSPKSVKYTEDEGYKLLIQKHPGKKAEPYNININYKGEQYSTEVIMDRDKVIQFKDGELKVEDYPEELDDFYDMINKVRGVDPEELEQKQIKKD